MLPGCGQGTSTPALPAPTSSVCLPSVDCICSQTCLCPLHFLLLSSNMFFITKTKKPRKNNYFIFSRKIKLKAREFDKIVSSISALQLHVDKIAVKNWRNIIKAYTRIVDFFRFLHKFLLTLAPF